MSARKQILQNIQQACVQITDAPSMPDLTFAAPNLSQAEKLEAFILKAHKAQANIIECDWNSLSEEIPFYCENFGLTDIYCQPDIQQQLHCNSLFANSFSQSLENLNEGGAIVKARYGLYETGTLVCSSIDQPSNTLFLPQHLFVVLSAQDLVWDIAEACQKLNQQSIDSRMLNFITGPSCTADIEQTLLYGAHGPKTLTIFLLRS
jgi:L-lactate utilization protein LutC